MLEADEEIREIKKEIIESRGLIIKTNNLTNALSADIKSIAKRQGGYERRLTLNSAMAYFLFAAITFGGLKLASDARINEIEATKDSVQREVRELRREVAEQARIVEQRERAGQRAAAFYELVRLQKRAEVIEGYPQLRRERLTEAEAAFFRDTVDRFRGEMSVAAFQAGLDLERTGRFAEAAESFEESTRLRDDASHMPQVKFHLAGCYRRLNRHREAIVLLTQILERNPDRELGDDVYWLLSIVYEELAQWDESRNALRTLMRRYPSSQLVPDSRVRISELLIRQRDARAQLATPRR